MNYMISILLVFSGLFVVNFIFSYQSKNIDPHFWTTFKFQLLLLPCFLAANLGIGYGVKFGYKALGNLSYVLAGSKVLELLISIFMGYFFFKEVPSWKGVVGFGLIIIGIIIAKLK